MSSAHHPHCIVRRAATGLGLFARHDFAKGDFVIAYTGTRLTTAQADAKGGRYLFALDDNFTIDGSARENIARYINHACKPNCEAIIEEYAATDKRIMIYAITAIAAGEELTFDYGAEYFNDFIAPQGCRCATCTNK